MPSLRLAVYYGTARWRNCVDKKSKKEKEEYHVNHSQRNLKKLIRAKEDSIADEELFLSAAYQKYQTSRQSRYRTLPVWTAGTAD